MSAPEPQSLPRRLLAQVPTVLALVGICAVGAWGMSTGWKLPKAGDPKSAAAEWCAEHSVPEDICVECKPDLMPRPEPFGWCRTHGVHECPLCHPEVAQLDSPYAVSEDDRARAKAALAFAPRPENGRKDVLHERLIQFASLEAYDRSGVEVSPAFRGA